ncbi:FAD-dependent monooxygenase [Nocardia altamirensis]|uniref:FAD-dependent monooxygenase n=1 Tax=Nocardia altamirensis TaxID=472158 RepID=UPI0008407F58|nr:FAD-dependent monooxygenase [Nocardia altamirensis]
MTSSSLSTVDEYEVVVVGAGPTGLLTAALLGGYGVSTLVVDQHSTPENRPDGVALDDEGLRALHAAGVGAALAPWLHHAPEVEYRSVRGYRRWHPPAHRPYGHPRLVTCRQSDLERVLRDRLACLDAVEIRSGVDYLAHDLAGGAITLLRDPATGADHRVFSQFLLACDGASGRVRRQLGLDGFGDTGPESWLVADVRDDRGLAGTRGRSAQPAAAIALPEGLRRFEVRLPAGYERAVAPPLLPGLLAHLLGADPLDVVDIAVQDRFFRGSDFLREGRVFLLGTAAHVIPPCAGVPFGTDLRDALNLAWKLAFALRGTLADDILDSYQLERGRHAARTADFADRMNRWLHGAPRGTGLRPLRPGPAFDTGFFDRTAGGGRLFPQPAVGAGRTRPLDDALGQGFAVLAHAGSRIPAAWWRARLGDDTVVARIRPQPTDFPVEPDVIVLDDPTGALVRACQAHTTDDAQSIVLRPDRVVFGAYHDIQVEQQRFGSAPTRHSAALI